MTADDTTVMKAGAAFVRARDNAFTISDARRGYDAAHASYIEAPDDERDYAWNLMETWFDILCCAIIAKHAATKETP